MLVFHVHAHPELCSLTQSDIDTLSTEEQHTLLHTGYECVRQSKQWITKLMLADSTQHIHALETQLQLQQSNHQTMMKDIIQQWQHKHTQQTLDIETQIERAQQQQHIHHQTTLTTLQHTHASHLQSLTLQLDTQQQSYQKQLDALQQSYQKQLIQQQTSFDTLATSLTTPLQQQIRTLQEQLHHQETKTHHTLHLHEQLKTNLQEQVQLELAKHKDKELHKDLAVLQRHTESNDKLHERITTLCSTLAPITKKTVHQGQAGEQLLLTLLQQALGCLKSKLKFTANQAHTGDIHIYTDDFRVLIDAKSYTHAVNVLSCHKLQEDMEANPDMLFGWMVSLDSPIQQHNQYPITCQWIHLRNGALRCLLFLNDLHKHGPIPLLMQAWEMCTQFYHILHMHDQSMTEVKYHTTIQGVITQIQLLQKHTKDMDTHILQLQKTKRTLDTHLIELLDQLSGTLGTRTQDLQAHIQQWIPSRIHPTGLLDTNKLTSTDIWIAFKRDETTFLTQHNELTPERFRPLLANCFPIEHIELHDDKKGTHGVFSLRGYTLLRSTEPPPKKKRNNKQTCITTTTTPVYV